jgi:hypothetical protein
MGLVLGDGLEEEELHPLVRPELGFSGFLLE